MKKTIIALLLALAVMVAAGKEVSAREKKVECAVEVVPNYLFHLFVISDIWGNGAGVYGELYGDTVDPADAAYLKSNGEMIAWGQSRVGELSTVLFFRPLSDAVSFESYCELVENVITYSRVEDWEGLDAYLFPAGEYMKYEDAPPHQYSSRQVDVLEETLRIMKDNYPAFMREVWPVILPVLEDGAEYLDGYFAGTDVINKWEQGLGRPYGPGSFVAVLTYANGLGQVPTGNNLGPRRNNFGYSEGTDPDFLKSLIIHEIGVFNLFHVITELSEDVELTEDFDPRSNLVYKAMESYLEMKMEDIFGLRVPGFSDGWQDEFEWFLEYYRKHDHPGVYEGDTIREAIENYTINRM